MADVAVSPPRSGFRNEAIPDVSEKEWARFWSHVQKEPNEGCWRWHSHINRGGYGEFWFRGRGILAHRFNWRAVHGAIPEGLQIDHICNTRSCVNLSHLRLVTPRVNAVRSEDGPTAVNHRKTHCKRGHEFTRENTLVCRDNERVCRACARELAYLKANGVERPKHLDASLNTPRNLKRRCQRVRRVE